MPGQPLSLRRHPNTGPLVSLEALEFVSPTAAVVEQPAPRTARSMVWLVAALFASTVALLGMIPVDRIIAAPGRVVSLEPTVTVQPIDTAIVRSVQVRANQVVKIGELLATLDPTFVAADVSSLETQVATLQAEVARLEAETAERDYDPGPSPQAQLQAAVFAQRRAEFGFRLETFRQRMDGLQATIVRARSEATFPKERLGVATQIETMRRDLERNQVGSRLNMLIAADTRLEVSRALAAAEGVAQISSRDLAGVRAERDAYVEQWRSQVAQDLAARRTSLAEAEEQLNKAKLRRFLVEMRSPVDGVVLELGKTSPGAVLQPGELLMSLVPLNAPLIIDADIAARDMGYVAPGDPVAIKFEAYNHIRHGVARGTVRNVSEDAFNREPSGPSRPPFYKARILIDDVSGLRHLPPDFRLIPGMPLAADIVIGERTILAYLFESTLRSAARGMREP